MLTPDEISKNMQGFSENYFLINVRNDKNDIYSVPEDFYIKKEGFLCLSAKAMNLIMDGELQKARDLIDSIPDSEDFYSKMMKAGLLFVHPAVTFKELIEILKFLKANKTRLIHVILTAGRPYILNGFNDFTRLSVFLPKHRELFIDYLGCIYDKELCPYIYNLCLAEYYYQQNSLIDAQLLASTTIKKFDIESERRIMFSALYLRSKILLATGNTVNSKNFIKDIRNLVKKSGNEEFSYNIDAAEILFALYEGKVREISDWLKTGAPDEYADFNMLDLYRYMIKMRCYIAQKNYSAVIALAERLRPLLEQGKRFMDLCELDVLLAMSLYLSDKKDFAFAALKRALKHARLHRYYRIIADEGSVMLKLLLEYKKEKDASDFIIMLIEMTRETAIRLPLYLMEQKDSSSHFTKMETDVLRLLEQGKTKEEIAEMFFISVNTVRFHIKNIYSKLEVDRPHQAVWQAKLRGII